MWLVPQCLFITILVARWAGRRGWLLPCQLGVSLTFPITLAGEVTEKTDQRPTSMYDIDIVLSVMSDTGKIWVQEGMRSDTKQNFLTL